LRDSKLSGTPLAGLQQELRKLWSLCDEQNIVPEMKATKSREDLEELLAVARQLWTKSESLLYAVADEDEEDNNMVVLMAECKNLLSACDDLIASKEEILRLYDLGTDTSVTEHEDDSEWKYL
jgi:hypothetical protein